MLMALIAETIRNHREDMIKYHDAMDEFWAEKRRENWRKFFRRVQRRSRGRWGATAQKKPAMRQHCGHHRKER